MKSSKLYTILNEHEEYDDDAYKACLECLGSGSEEEAEEIINNGDYIFFSEEHGHYNLGKAYVDMIGSPKDAISKDRIGYYIDREKVKDAFYNDSGEEMSDEEIEDAIDSYIDSDMDESFIDDFFDYEAFGRDLDYEGFTDTSLGWFEYL